MENSAEECNALCSQSQSDIAMTFAPTSDVPVATTSVEGSVVDAEDAVGPTPPDENELASDESMLGGDQAVIHLQIQQQGEEDAGNADGYYYYCFYFSKLGIYNSTVKIMDRFYMVNAHQCAARLIAVYLYLSFFHHLTPI